MVKLFKNHLSLCAITTAILFFVPNANAKEQAVTEAQSSVVVNSKKQNDINKFACDSTLSSYQCNDGKRHYIGEKVYQKTDGKDDETVAIQASKNGTRIEGKDITIKDALNPVVLDKSFWKYGIVADNSGAVEIETGVIEFTKGIAVQIKDKGHVNLKGMSITEKGERGMRIGDHSKNSTFQTSGEGGSISFGEGEVKVSNAHGVSFEGAVSYVDIINSTVLVEGNTAYGLRFFEGEKFGSNDKWIKLGFKKEELYRFWGEPELFGGVPEGDLIKRGSVHLFKTVLKVPKSAVIYSKNSGALVKALDNSELSGDLLLKAEEGSFVKVAADESVLVGGARIDARSHAEFRLREGTKWILTRPKNKSLHDSASSRSIGASSISLLHLIDSSLVFEQPSSSEVGHYQTLQIGKGSGVVYKAQGGARLYFNTYLDKGGALGDQKTDRLLIYGDVEGKTTVHVRAVSGSPGGGTGFEGGNKGISIIQVSGRAEEDSFQLAGDYVALDNLPYQYRLYAYGPSSRLGKASAVQRLVEGGGEHWDFRLENGYVDFGPQPSPGPEPEPAPDHRPTSPSRPAPEPQPEPSRVPPLVPDLQPRPKLGVKAVVPQVPTYLLLPNSVFHAGLMDISDQNKQLEVLRSASSGMAEIHEKPVSFLRGYGGSYRYVSDLSALEYGYSGDLTYNALEAGLLLQTIENADSALSFGIMGSYGKLSLQPVDVEQTQKNAFDKWTATAYGSMQHDVGFYVDGLLSYGLLKGDVATLARGKTATLKGKPLSVSLTGGQTFAMGDEGFVVDPQVQVVYQHLQFDKAHDVDDFDIEMGKLDKWMVRVGGRLTKMLSSSEKDHEAAFYGKLHFTHGFEGKQTVHFKDAFQLGAFGSSLEAGLGVNARLSSKFALHADLVYQHKLTKAGFSGVSFSGGLRYRF
ncbi:autotransporter outer membrane beta-barrel domain-containing protein [Bartonella machadoae]|uniref:autotransporter outer membrane beta-barrel domain-containing protein n=1 Tax=Bartonella machadoae TaxID=2893471 RepID=UPI001F4CFF25|nr:autotransporter outer membrane beta-barrel domain-containing protein [Bartonella machadoae]UNE53600.1 autotransporter outer membrane beta-barrel domain-containing protein [Bartonella machadoae]